MIRPRQLRKPLSFFFIFHPVANNSPSLLYPSTSKPIAHKNQPARDLSPVAPSNLGGLGVVMSHLSHALPSRAKVGHFLSAKRRHVFK